MIELQYDAPAIQATTTNGAPLFPLSGSNVDALVRSFDDTTEEFVTGKFQIPENFDVSGIVEISVVVTAKTASSMKKIKHRFGHTNSSNNESYDLPYTDMDSNDKEINAVQDRILTHSWSGSSLGWGIGDTVFFKYSRIQPSSNNLSGDLLLFNLVIKLPVV